MKMLNLTSEDDLNELIFLVTKNIKFLPESEISLQNRMKAIELTRNVDPNDSVFVAFNEHLDATLWTGDKQLRKGLKLKGYTKVANTQELLSLKGKGK